MDGSVSNDERREQIRAELEKLLRDRDERCRVSIQSVSFFIEQLRASVGGIVVSQQVMSSNEPVTNRL